MICIDRTLTPLQLRKAAADTMANIGALADNPYTSHITDCDVIRHAANLTNRAIRGEDLIQRKILKLLSLYQKSKAAHGKANRMKCHKAKVYTMRAMRRSKLALEKLYAMGVEA